MTSRQKAQSTAPKYLAVVSQPDGAGSDDNLLLCKAEWVRQKRRLYQLPFRSFLPYLVIPKSRQARIDK